MLFMLDYNLVFFVQVEKLDKCIVRRRICPGNNMGVATGFFRVVVVKILYVNINIVYSLTYT